MLQSSLSGWLKKPAASSETAPPPPPPPRAPAAPRRPPPPPKSTSAPPRLPLNRAPPSTAPTPTPKTTEQWNDIPEDFLSAPSSRPRSKKSPRPSATPTPASVSRTRSTAPTPPVPGKEAPLSNLFSLRPLPPNVELVPLTPDHLDAYKTLNALTLPIPYPDSFYKETMTEPHHSITLIALWHPTRPSTSPSSEGEPAPASPSVVGAIRCRLLPESQLYISTIGVLAPYREHGIAVHLLAAVVPRAVAQHGVRCVTAHVWEANDAGLQWYLKRRFDVVGKQESYYRKLQPSGALLVRKWIGIGDLLARAEGGGGA
ncbi:uncharacterized protein M421DRAFT_60750 [Didymella exigua CBS 183.55]|uniref:N-acetyltransferase domain-containing protein n=1 Tax=Didymella exigua CBS 183.55 TaxID=1150837 RepID=A0A6A5RPS7_9PLEO|nr:uncharacterized protein M421DRAFT_60750 [Didymella exigua CBS 183.55]KAF1929413.1 hypothetical protein M421DRAFT_60750 [Didymella exigua CBS 183.55]